MAPTMMASSVLVLRSSCPSGGEGAAQNSDNVTGMPLKDSGGGTASMHANNESNLELVLRRLYASTPLSCDVAILPEIPVHPRQHVSPEVIRLKQQSLNPCGMDNVLVLTDLLPPETAARSRGGDAYLMSLTSCQAIISTDHLYNETRASKGTPPPVQQPQEQSAEIVVSVHAVPSTFSFLLSSRGGGDMGDVPGEIVEGGVPSVATSHSYSELSVSFDMGPIERLVGRRLQPQHQRQQFSHEAPDEDTSGDDPTMPSSAHFHYPSPVRSTDRCESSSSEHRRNAELLMLLQDLAAKEARDITHMLAGLGALGVILVCNLIKMEMTRRVGRRRKRSGRNWSAVNGTRSRSLDAHIRTKGLVDESRDGENRASEQPPFTMVSVNHENSNAITPLSVEPESPPQPTRQPLVITPDGKPNVIGHDSDKKTHFESGHPMRYLPASQDAAGTSTMTSEDNVARPTKHHHFGGRFMTSGDPRHQKCQERKLSPCSRLEQEWLRNKDSRLSNRSADSKPLLVPKDGPTGSFSRMTGGSKLLSKLSPPKVLRVVSPSPLNQDARSGISSESTPKTRDPKLSPSDTPVSHQTGITFLNDYWGA